jgi:hypothetical protein
MIKIKRIFGTEMPWGSQQNFSYLPAPGERTLKGLLIMGNVKVTLTATNGTRLILQQLTLPQSINIPPDGRMINIDLPLNGTLLTGTVDCHAELSPSSVPRDLHCQTSVYALIQTEK